MCFARAWNTGFEDENVAPMLSHQRTCGWFWEKKLSMQRLHPYKSSCRISNRLVLSFSTTPRYHCLLVSTPGDQVWSKEHCTSPRGSPIIRTTSPSASKKTARTVEGSDRRWRPNVALWRILHKIHWYHVKQRIVVNGSIPQMVQLSSLYGSYRVTIRLQYTFCIGHNTMSNTADKQN
jgi:hypothetical protein